MSIRSYLLLALAILCVGCTRAPVGMELSYDFTQPLPPTDLTPERILELKRIVTRRINAERHRASVTFHEPRSFTIEVFGNDPAVRDLIDRRLAPPGELEFWILADRSRHVEVIAQAEASPDPLVLDASQKPLARWVRLDPQAQGIDLKTAIMRGDGDREVLVIQPPPLAQGDKVSPLVISDREFKKVMFGSDENQRPALQIYLDPRGGYRMKQITTELLAKSHAIPPRLAIVRDGRLWLALDVIEPIADSLVLPGDFDLAAVQDLVAIYSQRRLPSGLVRK